jgi:hypothetical protein
VSGGQWAVGNRSGAEMDGAQRSQWAVGSGQWAVGGAVGNRSVAEPKVAGVKRKQMDGAQRSQLAVGNRSVAEPKVAGVKRKQMDSRAQRDRCPEGKRSVQSAAKSIGGWRSYFGCQFSGEEIMRPSLAPIWRVFSSSVSTVFESRY